MAAKRTAFGAFGGKLKGHTGTDLAEIAARAALAAGNVSPEAVDTVIVGNVCNVSLVIIISLNQSLTWKVRWNTIIEILFWGVLKTISKIST